MTYLSGNSLKTNGISADGLKEYFPSTPRQTPVESRQEIKIWRSFPITCKPRLLNLHVVPHIVGSSQLKLNARLKRGSLKFNSKHCFLDLRPGPDIGLWIFWNQSTTVLTRMILRISGIKNPSILWVEYFLTWILLHTGTFQTYGTKFWNQWK